MTVSNTETHTVMPRSRSILELSSDEAREFFLKEKSYSNIGLPPYFLFNDLLTEVSKALDGKSLSDCQEKSPRDFESVNHLILNNKDGRHAWRPLQLVHPALYVSLVKRITEEYHWKLICDRFAEFAKNDKLKCLSLPIESLTDEKDAAEQVSHWWHTVEQASIELALDYEFVVHTDITDCYGAIYTHSIAWAIHTKVEAKKKRRDNDLIGNIIDSHIQDMSHGQTNGIPQGPVLMDFIAEMVLGYADGRLTEKIATEKIEDYRILRYRDDYRIFVNSSQDGEKILKCLTEGMIELGLKLNPAKTSASAQVIKASVKADKLEWMSRKQRDKNIQKHLLIIHDHSTKYPNAGSLAVALGSYQKRLFGLKKFDHPLPLISIVVDIAYHNPRTYSICAAILSKLLYFLGSQQEKKDVIEKIRKRFSQIPNTGHMKIWLQRITLPFDRNVEFDEPLCRLVSGEDCSIWNCEWISSNELKNAIDAKRIVNQIQLQALDAIVPAEEVELFISKAEDYY